MDLNVRAFRTVQAALQEPILPDKRKVASSKGGQRGGPSRAKAISAELRTEIAKKASRARWDRRRSVPATATSTVELKTGRNS
jgi:hypothetical protein